MTGLQIQATQRQLFASNVQTLDCTRVLWTLVSLKKWTITGEHLSHPSVWIRTTKSKRNMHGRSLKALSLHLSIWTFCSIPASKNVAHLFSILQLNNSPRIIPFSWDWYSAHWPSGVDYTSVNGSMKKQNTSIYTSDYLPWKIAYLFLPSEVSALILCLRCFITFIHSIHCLTSLGGFNPPNILVMFKFYADLQWWVILDLQINWFLLVFPLPMQSY